MREGQDMAHHFFAVGSSNRYYVNSGKKISVRELEIAAMVKRRLGVEGDIPLTQARGYERDRQEEVKPARSKEERAGIFGRAKKAFARFFGGKR
jgi:hypothetical protein